MSNTSRSHSTTISVPWLMAAVALAAGPACGAEPTPVSREALVHRWDLDGNGTIDESEAAIARSRMRRERMEIEAQSAIDPLTGRPRSAAEQDAPPVEAPVVEPPPPRRRSSDDQAPPGTRVPEVKRPAEAAESPLTSPPGQARPLRRPSDPRRTGGAEPAAPANRAGAFTGGARANAPAARPGYGSQVVPPAVNAGRPRLPFGTVPESQPRPTAGRVSGGLVPRPQPPGGSGGSARRAADAGRPPVVPPAPAVPRVSGPARVTAEDIGGG